jgi:hypothetical protein
MEAQAQTPQAEAPQSCPIGKRNIHCHATQHTNLKKKQCFYTVQSLYKKLEHHHFNLKSEERVQNIH